MFLDRDARTTFSVENFQILMFLSQGFMIYSSGLKISSFIFGGETFTGLSFRYPSGFFVLRNISHLNATYAFCQRLRNNTIMPFSCHKYTQEHPQPTLSYLLNIVADAF